MAGERIRPGKAAEHIVVGMLVEAGLDLYLTVADDQGIDAIIRSRSGKKHYDLQIKGGSTWNSPRGLHADRIDRSNLIVVLYNSTSREIMWFLGSELAKSGLLLKGSFGAVRLLAAFTKANAGRRDAAALSTFVDGPKRTLPRLAF